MNLEPIFEEIQTKKILKKITGEIKVSANTNLPTEEVIKILAVKDFVSLSHEEFSAGTLSIGGRAIFCMVFRDFNGALRKTECGTEFSCREATDGLPQETKATTKLSVVKVTAEKEGQTVVISAVVRYETVFSVNEKLNMLTGGDGLILKKCNSCVVREIPAKKTVYPASDEFELEYSVREVLVHESSVYVTAVQCGVGTIVLDGEIILSLSLLQKIENSDILKETKNIPFRLEMECDDAMPSCLAYAEAVIKSVKLDITVDEQSGKSTVSANMQIEVTGSCFEQCEKEIVTDAYYTSCECEVSKAFCQCTLPLQNKIETVNVSTKGAFINPLEAGSRLMTISLLKLNLTSVRAEDSGIYAEGVFEGTAFCKDMESRIFTSQIQAPFEFKLPSDVGDNEYALEVYLTSCQGKVVSLENVELDLVIKAVVKTKEPRKTLFLDGVTVGEEKTASGCAISVYIPLEGEDLWDVAKRLNTHPETITELNGDLAYPLSGNERIVIYRQEKREF